MKILTCIQPGKFQYSEKEQPATQPRQSLLRIRRIGICGTDLHAFDGTQPYFNYPRVLGHELAGEIVETDSASFSIGETVTFIPYYHCGHCIACRNGKTNCCVSMQVCGVHVDGGMAEYLSVPTAALVKGEGLTVDQLALTEPFAIAAHAVRRANIQHGEYVLVMGAGPIGLGVAAFALISGAQVIMMDVNDTRLDFARDQLKVHYTVNARDSDATNKISNITDGDMPTVVLDATGNLAAINNGFRYMAHGARYVLVGLQKEELHFSHPEFHKRESTLMSSRNALRTDFEWVIDCIKNQQLDPLKLITHRVDFEDLATVFKGYSDPVNGVIKAMVRID